MTIRDTNFLSCLMTILYFCINSCVLTAGFLAFNWFCSFFTATTVSNLSQMNTRKLASAKMQTQGNTNYTYQVKGT